VVEARPERRLYEVVAFDKGTNNSFSVIKVHSRQLADVAVDLCDGIASRSCTGEQTKKAWGNIRTLDAGNFASGGSDPYLRQERLREVVDNVYASFRIDPLVKFGRVYCTRRSVGTFFLSKKDASVFIHMKNTDGEMYLCWVGKAVPDSEEAEKMLDTFAQIANAQLITTEVKLDQMGFPELAAQYKADAVAARAAQGPQSHKEGIQMAERHVKNPTAHLDKHNGKDDHEEADDDDDDKDDKPVKKTRTEAAAAPAPPSTAAPIKFDYVAPLKKVVDEDDGPDRTIPEPLNQLVVGVVDTKE
jgi:hypothetical protein